jgi:hypothetical protein
MPLARKDRRQPRAPDALHGREYAQLVIDHHVVLGGIAPLDRAQHQLLVQVDEHPAGHRVPEPGTLHLARLKHHVPVREDHGASETGAARERAQGAGIEALRKRVIDQERGHSEQLRVIEVLQPVALQGPEVIGVPELRSQPLEQRPVTVAAGAAKLTLQVFAQVPLNGVVVDQGVVDIEQKDDFRICHLLHVPGGPPGAVYAARGNGTGTPGVNPVRRDALHPIRRIVLGGA